MLVEQQYYLLFSHGLPHNRQGKTFCSWRSLMLHWKLRRAQHLLGTPAVDPGRRLLPLGSRTFVFIWTLHRPRSAHHNIGAFMLWTMLPRDRFIHEIYGMASAIIEKFKCVWSFNLSHRFKHCVGTFCRWAGICTFLAAAQMKALPTTNYFGSICSPATAFTRCLWFLWSDALPNRGSLLPSASSLQSVLWFSHTHALPYILACKHDKGMATPRRLFRHVT